MDANEKFSYLTGEHGALDALGWLQNDFLPDVVSRLRHDDVLRGLALYPNERIPENERNLTDVRNRVSLIIEYETARITNEILRERKIRSVFASYVVANRFPDIEVRKESGERGLRFEIKCLQSIAEEKSANFDALIKDIHPRTDFLLIFLWDWEYGVGEIPWERAVHVKAVYCFHAYSLALFRDHYWLNSPPDDLGDGCQGFDLRFGINCAEGQYNEEEGNYGKLLRLWSANFPHRPPTSPIMDKTEADYLSFCDDVIVAGFDLLSNRILPKLSGVEKVEELKSNGTRVGWYAGNVAFLRGAAVTKKKERLALCKDAGASRAYVLTEKYAWSAFDVQNGAMTKIDEGKKPKKLIPDPTEN